MTVSHDAIMWTYRIVLGREPEAEDVAAALAEATDPTELIQRLAESEEFSRSGRYEALFAPEEPAGAGWRRYWSTRSGPQHANLSLRDAASWSFRLLLGCEPDSAAIAEILAGKSGVLGIVRSILSSRAFLGSDRCERLFPSHSAGQMRRDSDGFRGMPICELPRICFADARASKIGGTIVFPKSQSNLLTQLRIHFTGTQSPDRIFGIEINLASLPHLDIHFADSDEHVTFGAGCEGKWTLRMWGNCVARIGARTTANGAECFVNPGGALTIGEDCMLADPTMHVGDNHAVFDLETLAPTNLHLNPKIAIDDHVWLGARSTILTNSRIGLGCVVGSGATVKGDIPACSLVVGNPGRVVRSGVSWTRSHDAAEAEAVASMIHAKQAP